MLSLPSFFSDKIIRQAQEVEVLIGRIPFVKSDKIKLVDSFLSMEEDAISLSTLQKILTGKRVSLAPYLVTEVQNILQVCHSFPSLNPLSLRDFKKTHAGLLMGLATSAGQWRKETVFVTEGKTIAYIPPDPLQIPALMQALFHYTKSQRNLSWVIRACVFHYGIQAIHPFIDGNGRMGRIWQHLLLLQASPVFQQVLIGQIIKTHANLYYTSLDKSDRENDCSLFLDFCLRKLLLELKKHQ